MKTAHVQTIMPRWLSSLLLGVLVTVVILMPIHAFVSTWGGTAIGPLWLWKSWKELLLTTAAVVAFGWLFTQPGALRRLLRDRLVVVILGYTVLTIGMTAVGWAENGRDAAIAGLGMNLRYLLAATLAYLLFRYSQFSYDMWRTKAAKFLIGAGVLLALVGVIQVQWLSPTFLERFGYSDTTIAPAILIDENPEAPRAFATLRGPNDYGAYLVLPLVLLSLLTFRARWAWLGVAVIAIGLFESSSRSAWLGAGSALIGLALLSPRGIDLRHRRTQLIAAVVLLAGVMVAVAALSIPSVRLEVFHSSPDDPSILEGSTAKHFQSTGEGVGRVIDRPLGCGVGCAGPASYYGETALISENYFVQVAEETGVVGLGLWLAAAGVVVLRLYRLRDDWLARALLASFIGLTVIGLWLHVWADDPLSLTWWALAGMVLGAAGRRSQKAL